MGANFEYFLNLKELFLGLPLHKHHLLPGTLVELFLCRDNIFSYLGKPSNYVVPVSLLVPYILVNHVLTLIYQHDFSRKLEHYTFGCTQSQVDLFQLKLENDCYTQILLNASNILIYLIYTLRTF